MHEKHKNIISQNNSNEPKQLKSPGFVAAHDRWPGNRMGLFSKEKVIKEVDK